MNPRLKELLAAGLGALREHGPAVTRACTAGAGALEYTRDLAAESAAGLRSAVTVLEDAGVVKKRTAKAARKACGQVEVAAQVASVAAAGARGVARVATHGPARAAKGERG